MGDTLDLTVTGGRFLHWTVSVTVLQLGSDACTFWKVEGGNSLFVVDMPIILEGANDSQYPPRRHRLCTKVDSI